MFIWKGWKPLSSCQLAALLSWGPWAWLSPSLPWGPSVFCEPGTCHCPQDGCEHQRPWQLVKAGAGCEQLAWKLAHSMIAGSQKLYRRVLAGRSSQSMGLQSLLPVVRSPLPASHGWDRVPLLLWRRLRESRREISLPTGNSVPEVSKRPFGKSNLPHERGVNNAAQPTFQGC